jgi:hypothetical protein
MGETELPHGLADVVRIDARCAALRSDGTLVLWGRGIGDRGLNHSATEIPKGVREIDFGENFAVAILGSVPRSGRSGK